MKSLFFVLIFLSISSFAGTQSVVVTDPPELSWWGKMRNYLPNAVTVDLAQNQSQIMLKDRPSLRADNKSISDGGDFSHLANAISITSIPGQGDDPGFKFKWVPTFTFAFNNLTFDSDSAFIRDTDFQIFRTSLGIGPEISHKTFLGTFYLNIAPGVSYSWVSWSSPASGGSMARSNGNLSLSLGYFNYIAKNWAFRLFARTVLEDTEVWKEALDSSQGFDIPVERVINYVGGISVCYVF